MTNSHILIKIPENTMSKMFNGNFLSTFREEKIPT